MANAEEKSTEPPEESHGQEVMNGSRKPRKKLPLYLKIIIIILVLAALGGGYAEYRAYRHHAEVVASAKANSEAALANKALLKNNQAEALADAKKALAAEPNNIDDILAVANLTKAQDPSAAKQYFVQAFNVFKAQNDPDASGKSAEIYWAAAGLAEQAGEISQAKHYYQEVIKVANQSDSYQLSLASQSRAALQRLQ